MGEIVFHIAILAALGFFYNDTLSIDTTRITDVVGAAGFPKAIIVLTFVLTAISLYFVFRKYIEESHKNIGKKLVIEELNVQFLGLIGSVVAFIFVSEWLGYFPTSILLVFFIMFLLGQRKISKIFITSIVTSVVFTLIFGKLLHVPLPRGIGFIQELSFLLY
ncbi:MAG: tripartite tricarboxylate transporter TctB family protein [Sulfurospirillaceae bacterium]|nr:tripartite tricarboxylate transporter TctB family protein [Sulfurospirillaceae bacterium]